ncbi:hypothetical protein ACFL1X_03780 [Candidatus Hydrogenedentota bacterium]
MNLTKPSWAVLLIVVGGILTGNATCQLNEIGPWGRPKPTEDQIREFVETWSFGINSGNVGQLMLLYSDAFRDDQGRGKALYLSEVEMEHQRRTRYDCDNSGVELFQSKRNAKATNIIQKVGNTGRQYEVTLRLIDERGTWRIIGLEREPYEPDDEPDAISLLK